MPWMLTAIDHKFANLKMHRHNGPQKVVKLHIGFRNQYALATDHTSTTNDHLHTCLMYQ